MSNKADKDHWNRLHASGTQRIASKSDNIRRWIERHIPPVAQASSSCLEIGCCPGRYLAVLGELGYELFGVDLAENIHTMPDWLKSRNFGVGSFWQEDFLQFDFRRKFDIVMSLGFIEHFTNWREVLLKHCDLVEPGGYLVIEAPNFIGGFQHWLHYHLDRENYNRHYIPAMDVDAWSAALRANGFDIVFKGYFGKFDFWVEGQHRTTAQEITLKALSRVKGILKWILPPDKKMYSPVGGVIARKVKPAERVQVTIDSSQPVSGHA